ncbi:MAG TPA: helix-turn-helix domain-containing protein [Alphaproteobacteria bacterium]|nr:helix-turn-helix domain-containing protein [Alphaproteobacteria bacterium]
MAAVTKVSRKAAASAAAAIDWQGINALSEEDIARHILENADAAPDLTLARIKLLFRARSKRLTTRHKIQLVRRALNMSQAEFARAYHFSLRTLQNWEQGTREPDETIDALIKLIAFEPERVRRILAA